MQAKHNEWLIDEAIRESFPASDPVAASQPGSILNLRYAARDRSAEITRSEGGMSAVVAAACIAFCVGALLGRRW